MSPEAERQIPLQAPLFAVGGAVLTLVLLVATGSLGVAGFLLVVLISVPTAYVHMRYGTAAGVGAVALTAFGSYLFDGAVGGVGYLLQFGMISIILPYLLRREWAWDKSAAVSVVAITLGSFLLLAAYAGSVDSTMGEQIDLFASSQVEQAMAIYGASDLPPEQLEELKGAAERMAGYLRYAYAGAAVTVTGVLALLLVWILSALAKGCYAIPGVEFSQWKAPELMVWPLIAAGFAAAFTDGELKQVGMNLLVVMLPIYFLQGTAIVTHFFNRRKVPPFIRGLGYVLIAFLNPMPIVITSIGVFDLWIDFRKPRVKTT